MNIPNLLTLLRIALIPLFIFFLAGGSYYMALAVFAAGGITDVLDGFLARRLDQITELGRVLDPIADKLFFLTSFTALYLINILPLWLLTLAILKEVIILSGCAALYLTIKKVEIKPTAAGKATTAIQTAVILLILLNEIGAWNERALFVAFIAASIFIIASTFSYVMMGLKMYFRGVS